MHIPPLAIIPPVVPTKWEGTHPAGRDSRRSAGAASPPRWAEWWRPRTVRRLWRWTASSGSTCTAGGSRPRRSGCRRGRGSSRGLGEGTRQGLATGLRHNAWSPHVHACVLTQSCPTLCDPVYHSPPGFSVHGILQARILERVAMPRSRESSPPGNRTCVS